MRRVLVIAAIVVVSAGALACHPPPRAGTTSLTSVPISSEAPSRDTRLVAPSPPETSAALPVALTPPDEATTPSPAVPASTTAPMGARAPLVSPGLDNTVTGGVANTGAPLNYGYGNNGNVGPR